MLVCLDMFIRLFSRGFWFHSAVQFFCPYAIRVTVSRNLLGHM